MATLTGNDGVVKIDNASGTKTAVANIKSFSVDITSDKIETTTMGNDSRTYVKGLSSWSGSADVYFDPSAFPTSSASGLTSLNPTNLAVGSAPIGLEFYLAGTADKFSGYGVVTGYNVKSSMDGMVEATIAFQGSGALTFTA